MFRDDVKRKKVRGKTLLSLCGVRAVKRVCHERRTRVNKLNTTYGIARTRFSRYTTVQINTKNFSGCEPRKKKLTGKRPLCSSFGAAHNYFACSTPRLQSHERTASTDGLAGERIFHVVARLFSIVSATAPRGACYWKVNPQRNTTTRHRLSPPGRHI